MIENPLLVKPGQVSDLSYRHDCFDFNFSRGLEQRYYPATFVTYPKTNRRIIKDNVDTHVCKVMLTQLMVMCGSLVKKKKRNRKE